ncbi:MAG: polyprenyl synthetase family protein [Thermoguttaceae bacterium]
MSVEVKMTTGAATPSQRSDRDAILVAIETRIVTGDGANNAAPTAWTRDVIEHEARELLASLAMPDEHLAWTMVAIGSHLWRNEVMRVPYSRRILLLPHCLRDANECPATMNADGLLCQECGRCSLGAFKSRAESLGYRVLVAEGTPIVSRWIVSGKADAILGVGCLKSLERAFDKLAFAGIPAMAVPLLTATCKQTTADDDFVTALIDTPFVAGASENSSPAQSRCLTLLRHAASLFESPHIETLLPQRRSGDATLGKTEQIAHKFLVGGGKFYRPFLTLAVFDALARRNDDNSSATWSDDVHRVAMAMEVFHKASLVHDDIEDDDPFRYGVPTLHKKYGVATAINVGDYLIGLGYRLIAETSFAAATRGRLLTILSSAHTRLAEGQGADIIHRGESLAPLETLKIYALKTSPAFEAAILSGVAITEDDATWNELREPLVRFCRHLGIAFQIHNDLQDWLDTDDTNKRSRGRDAAEERPTILRALAVQFPFTGKTDAEILAHYHASGAWQQTHELLAKYRTLAHEIVRDITHTPLRELLEHMLATVV